ncbi:hypothetical protein NDU88_005131 [Pleurodeles waltl]|uniref:Uncharacterized protein n=1 Tax=Pleurodeles waltl TaxID=8319 RepID=A0AAV7TAR7_PLEWA|nr:hypothetical protein NDU88_005131 [Pleurodeles waltl]
MRAIVSRLSVGSDRCAVCLYRRGGRSVKVAVFVGGFRHALQCRVTTLEELQIELQLKQKDFENRSRKNNICMSGIPTGADGMDIMASTADLLHAIRGDKDASP